MTAGQKVTFEKLVKGQWHNGTGKVAYVLSGIGARIVGTVNGRRVQIDSRIDAGHTVRNIQPA